MEVIRNLNDIEKISDGVISVGTFDGIHLAHQAILKTALKYAEIGHTKVTVVTFDPHPRLVVKQKNGAKVKLLTTVEEKVQLLEKHKIGRVVIIPFTLEFSRTSPEDFIMNILCEKIGLKRLVIGYDHGFGKNRSGDIEFLKEAAKKCGFIVDIQEPISNKIGIISSTLIRNLLTGGEVEKAYECLGQPYSLTGKVVKGDGRGKTISYPTANILIDDENKCIPKSGVYSVKIKIANKSHNGVMNIGVRPTFGGDSKVLEAHIFDFNETLYDFEISISFMQRIRPEKKFDSIEELKKQIDSDAETACKYFDGN